MYSTTQATNLVGFAALIVLIAKHFKFDLAQEDVLALLTACAGVFAVIANWVHRYKKGDLTVAGFRK